jgi:tetrahydromethanopterin S-methyltransferase subunit E
MRIGSSIALIALGLILALAVSVNVRGIDLTLVGWILTAVGVLGLIVSLALSRRNRSVVAPARDPYGPGADPYPSERDPRY